MSKSAEVVDKQRSWKAADKVAITKPFECLGVNLSCLYTLHGKDSTIIDLVCLTMIDSATSWFQMVELPLMELSYKAFRFHGYKKGRKRLRGTKTHDKNSALKTQFWQVISYCRVFSWTDCGLIVPTLSEHNLGQQKCVVQTSFPDLMWYIWSKT